MTRTQIPEITEDGQNTGAEFLSDVVQSHKLAKEQIALSDFDGRMDLLGFDDDGVISGLSRERPKEWVISPNISDIFLHHVLDRWTTANVALLMGALRFVRQADDFVIACRNRRDGERVLAALDPGKEACKLRSDAACGQDLDSSTSGPGLAAKMADAAASTFSVSTACGASQGEGCWWSSSSPPAAISIAPADRHGTGASATAVNQSKTSSGVLPA